MASSHKLSGIGPTVPETKQAILFELDLLKTIFGRMRDHEIDIACREFADRIISVVERRHAAHAAIPAGGNPFARQTP